MENYAAMKIARKVDIYGCTSGALICAITALRLLLENKKKDRKTILLWLEEHEKELDICLEYSKMENMELLAAKTTKAKRIIEKVKENLQHNKNINEIRQELATAVKELEKLRSELLEQQEQLKKLLPALI
ncbi:MAG: hypothetical protein GXO42_02430 [bacterium]|nr:hypothetical protein [bacterium]